MSAGKEAFSNGVMRIRIFSTPTRCLPIMYSQVQMDSKPYKIYTIIKKELIVYIWINEN